MRGLPPPPDGSDAEGSVDSPEDRSFRFLQPRYLGGSRLKSDRTDEPTLKIKLNSQKTMPIPTPMPAAIKRCTAEPLVTKYPVKNPVMVNTTYPPTTRRNCLRTRLDDDDPC
jgi:hypothetical protein